MAVLPGTVTFSVAKVLPPESILTGGGRTMWEMKAVAGVVFSNGYAGDCI
jgi:hypothetical protein